MRIRFKVSAVDRAVTKIILWKYGLEIHREGQPHRKCARKNIGIECKVPRGKYSMWLFGSAGKYVWLFGSTSKHDAWRTCQILCAFHSFNFIIRMLQAVFLPAVDLYWMLLPEAPTRSPGCSEISKSNSVPTPKFKGTLYSWPWSSLIRIRLAKAITSFPESSFVGYREKSDHRSEQTVHCLAIEWSLGKSDIWSGDDPQQEVCHYTTSIWIEVDCELGYSKTVRKECIGIGVIRPKQMSLQESPATSSIFN